jgi:hypothetical protein
MEFISCGFFYFYFLNCSSKPLVLDVFWLQGLLLLGQLERSVLIYGQGLRVPPMPLFKCWDFCH